LLNFEILLAQNVLHLAIFFAQNGILSLNQLLGLEFGRLDPLRLASDEFFFLLNQQHSLAQFLLD